MSKTYKTCRINHSNIKPSLTAHTYCNSTHRLFLLIFVAYTSIFTAIKNSHSLLYPILQLITLWVPTTHLHKLLLVPFKLAFVYISPSFVTSFISDMIRPKLTNFYNFVYWTFFTLATVYL